MEFAAAHQAMREAAHALTAADAPTRVRAIQQAQDALDAAKAQCLAEITVTKDHELDGASTLGAWVRNELRMSSGEAAALVRAAATCAALPAVAEAAAAGRIRTAHVAIFTYGLRHIGADIMAEFQEAFVSVAQEHEPAKLFEMVKTLREAVFPDDLDAAWVKGMAKQDIKVVPVPGGFHVTGFLDPVTGAKFVAVLDSVSAPRDEKDERSGSERRIQGLDDVLSSILANGMPSDKGVRPQLSALVDADTLAAAAEHVRAMTDDPHLVPRPGPRTTPGRLIGYGSVGPALLMYLHCISDFTAYLMTEGGGRRQADVLDVGRSHRLATLKQRRAIIVRQKGVCAAPGCHHTHLEMHHTVFWSHGGPTDLDLMIGLCSRCHHLLHRGRLHITGNAREGFTFTNRLGHPVRPRRRQTSYTPAA